MPKPVTPPSSQEASSNGERKSMYRVKRVFPTVQGEGFWSGCRAVFVRLVGCNMWSGYEEHRERDAERNDADCPLWCDTDFTPERSTQFTAEEVLELVQQVRPNATHVVFTGGEPLLQLDSELIEVMHRAGIYVHVETNGTVRAGEVFTGERPDWICCSPKQEPERIALKQMDELKLIVPDYLPKEYRGVAERVTAHRFGTEMRRPLYVQPEDGPRLQAAKAMCVEIVEEKPEWLISTQTHKTLGID